MDNHILNQLQKLNFRSKNDDKVIQDIFSHIQNLNTEFELNPYCLDIDVIKLLDTTADEFAFFLKSIAHLNDQTSQRRGEQSLKIIKLCMILQNKIFDFQNRKNNRFILN